MLWLTIIVLIIGGVIVFLLKARPKQETIKYPYQKAGILFYSRRTFLLRRA